MTSNEEHYKKLERMYLSAPVNNQIYSGIAIDISAEHAELSLRVEHKFFHAAGGIHGSVYFKLLDDAAFFAVNSVVHDVFVYTVTYQIQFLRPVNTGMIRSVGDLKFKSANLFIADSVLVNDQNKIVGRGSGNFMKSKIALTEKTGYL